MRKLSRGALAAVVAAVAIPAGGVAIAHNFDRGGWRHLSPDARARLDDGRLAMAKTALKLNPDQEKLWAPVETEIRASFKLRADRIAEREKAREERRKEREANKDGKDGKDAKSADAKSPDMADRIAKMSQRMSERAERMKNFSTAFSPFYASLSDEQKEVLRPLARELLGGGPRGGGKRWAMGGGWGERGHHGGGWHRGPRGDGPQGPGYRDERSGGAGVDNDGERGPPADQLAPDQDDDGAPSDKL